MHKERVTERQIPMNSCLGLKAQSTWKNDGQRISRCCDTDGILYLIKKEGLLNFVTMLNVVPLDWNELYDQGRKSGTMFHHKATKNHTSCEAVCHGFEGILHETSFGFIYIDRSAEFPMFFEAYRRIYCSSDIVPLSKSQPVTWFPRFNLNEVNLLVTALKNNVFFSPKQQKVAALLTADDIAALPTRFDLFCVKMSTPWIAVVDSKLIRAAYNKQSQTIRWNVYFSIQINPIIQSSMIKEKAQQFERERMNATHEIWPLPLPDAQGASEPRFIPSGIVVIPLDAHVMEPFIASIDKYLCHIIGLDGTLRQPRIVRLSRDSSYRGSHIPTGHGRTWYGHYCVALVDLFTIVAPMIRTVLQQWWPAHAHTWVTDANIGYQSPWV